MHKAYQTEVKVAQEERPGEAGVLQACACQDWRSWWVVTTPCNKGFYNSQIRYVFASRIRQWKSAAKTILRFMIGQGRKTTFLKVVAIQNKKGNR